MAHDLVRNHPPPNVLWSAAGGSGTFAVNTSTGCAWTAASEASWLTVTSGSGSGEGSVAFTVAKNSAAAAREGTIDVAGQKYTVVQYGTSGSCPFTLAPAQASFTRAGGTGTVTVTTLTGCFWSVFSDAAWVTVDLPALGFGSGSATFQVQPNTSGATRSATMFVGGSFTPNVTVTQSAEGSSKRRGARH